MQPYLCNKASWREIFVVLLAASGGGLQGFHSVSASLQRWDTQMEVPYKWLKTDHYVVVLNCALAEPCRATSVYSLPSFQSPDVTDKRSIRNICTAYHVYRAIVVQRRAGASGYYCDPDFLLA